MESTLVSQGFDLLLYGMGTVFTFLTLLVGITTLMSVVVNKLVIDQPETTTSPQVGEVNGQHSIEPRVIKVIQAALDQHRRKS